MTYKLYNRLGSGGFATEAALAVAGVPFELELIESAPGTPLPETFRAINPWRQVPTLVTPEGAVLTETAATLIHISLAHPGPDVGPAPGSVAYTQLLRWTSFLGANVYESVRRRAYPETYTTDPDGVAGVREAAIARIGEAFALVESVLEASGFLLGDSMSVADIYAAMLFAWHRNHEPYPCCTKLTERVASHDIIAPIWQRNFGQRLSRNWGS